MALFALSSLSLLILMQYDQQPSMAVCLALQVLQVTCPGQSQPPATATPSLPTTGVHPHAACPLPPSHFSVFTNRMEDMRLQDLAEMDVKELVHEVSLDGPAARGPAGTVCLHPTLQAAGRTPHSLAFLCAQL